MKPTSYTRHFCLAALLAGSSLLAAGAASATDLVYTVTLNTASLVGNGNGPFSLDVALGSGSQAPNSDNTVKLSNFAFTNGSVGATTYLSGGVTGAMSSSVTLVTSGEDNELSQSFSSTVTQISFNVDETPNTNNPFPDQFTVSILDGGLNNIPTTDPSGANTLVLENINTAQNLNSVATYRSTAGGEAPGVSATAVPEPGSLAALIVGCGAAGWGFVRQARRRLLAA